jgi:hypothetical protein
LIIKDGAISSGYWQWLGMSVTDARLCFERHATSKIIRQKIYFHCIRKGFVGKHWLQLLRLPMEMKTKQDQELGTQIVEGSVSWSGIFQGRHLRSKSVFQYSCSS